MASNWPQPVLATYPAGADLSTLQYTFVKLNSNAEVIAVAAATDIPIGVLQNDPKSGESASVLIIGGSKLKASAAISLPALLGTTSVGRAVKLAAGTDTTKYILAQADEAANADGDVISVLVNCATPARAA